MSDHAISAIVFDVGRVIVQWNLRHLFAKLIEEPAELDRFLTEVVTEEWHFQHDAGRPLAEMVPELQAEYPHHAEHIAAYRDRFLDTIPGPVPGTLAIIERLLADGWPLYAITNFGAEFWAQFRPTMPIFDRFEDIVVSGKEKLVKPDPAIFQLAAKRFDRSPETMLFIDDNAANVEAASVLGWHTHHFHNAAGLAADLERRGI